MTPRPVQTRAGVLKDRRTTVERSSVETEQASKLGHINLSKLQASRRPPAGISTAKAQTTMRYVAAMA